MPDYRLYHLSAQGRITSRDDISAKDDQAAAELARSFHHKVDCELWCRARRVALIPAATKVAAVKANKRFEQSVVESVSRC